MNILYVKKDVEKITTDRLIIRLHSIKSSKLTFCSHRYNEFICEILFSFDKKLFFIYLDLFSYKEKGASMNDEEK